jgi:hypothetical protein
MQNSAEDFLQMMRTFQRRISLAIKLKSDIKILTSIYAYRKLLMILKELKTYCKCRPFMI